MGNVFGDSFGLEPFKLTSQQHPRAEHRSGAVRRFREDPVREEITAAATQLEIVGKSLGHRQDIGQVAFVDESAKLLQH